MFSVEAKSIVEQQQEKVKDEQQQDFLKQSLMSASFTPVQLQALKQLFATSPAARQIVLSSFAADSGATLGRSDSFDSLPSAFATPTHQNRRSDSNSSDNESAASSASQRIHHKDAQQKLAGYLVKNYFSAKPVWDYLYAKNNRINSKRLTKVLGQLEDKLTPAQKKTLNNNRKAVTQKIKKKINAARNYRRKLFNRKGKTIKSPYAHTIDLTISDDESDSCDKADKPTKVEKNNEVDKVDKATADDKKADKATADDKKADKATADDKKADKATTDDSETEEEPAQDKSVNQRKKLAKKFAERMKSLRSSRKKIPAKSGSSSKRKRTSRRTTTEKTKESSTTINQESASSSKRKRTSRRTTTEKTKESSTTINQESASKSSWKQREMETCPTFKKGSRVMGMWTGPECTGDWYEGVVKSINKRKKTAHVVYDDGDSDKVLEWTNMRVIDP